MIGPVEEFKFSIADVTRANDDIFIWFEDRVEFNIFDTLEYREKSVFINDVLDSNYPDEFNGFQIIQTNERDKFIKVHGWREGYEIADLADRHEIFVYTWQFRIGWLDRIKALFKSPAIRQFPLWNKIDFLLTGTIKTDTITYQEVDNDGGKKDT